MKHIARTTIIIAVFFGLEKLLGFLRNVIIARTFGLSTELDAFNAANNIPDLLFALISGGALAIGVADRVIMLQYSIYSVISPEGCASILWKSADKAKEAADAMGITAERLYSLKLVDEVVSEPLGGAHRDPDTMAQTLKNTVINHLDALDRLSTEALLEARYQRLMAFGRFNEE